MKILLKNVKFINLTDNIDLLTVFDCYKKKPRLIISNKFFQLLQINEILFSEEEKKCLLSKFGFNDLKHSALLNDEDLFSVSSINSCSQEEIYINISEFFDWLNISHSLNPQFNLNHLFFEKIVNILKEYPLLMEQFLEKSSNLDNLILEVQQFLEINFIEYENDFKFNNSTKDLEQSNFNQ